jgi:hypothetical protein
MIGKTKWFTFFGCETDLNFPNEKSINKYLKENRNSTGTNILKSEAYSIIIELSV